MSFSKFIGGAAGWIFGGPIGGILGFAFGSVLDGLSGNSKSFTSEEFKTYKPNQHQRTQSGDFEVSLLILSSIVIKADGKQDKRELDFVRLHFKNMYGSERANHAFTLFKQLNKNTISKRQVCLQMKQMMTHATRLQLLHFLFGLALADEVISDEELLEIKTIANYLGISLSDFESIKSMFYKSVDASYKILEINKDVSDAEVKKAYRKMAKKYHPDRVRHLGEEHLQGAEEKFRSVQEAYEAIQKERGFK